MSLPRRRSSTVPPYLVEENWLDRAIGEARQRGDFEDLPGHGQPLHIERNELAPEWDMAFRVLKNAGFAPTWMELGKEIETQTAALRRFLDETMHRISEEQPRLRSATPSTAVAPADATAPLDVPARRGWSFRRRHPVHPSIQTPSPENALIELEQKRLRARREYLERAARLDAKIVEYHRELPDDLWRLQRGRQTPEIAARAFDAACPPIGADHQI